MCIDLKKSSSSLPLQSCPMPAERNPLPLRNERMQLIAFCNRMLEQKLTHGTGGNISIRHGRYAVISPSGVPYPSLTAQDIPIVRIEDDAVVAGTRKPSSELALHLALYRARPDAQAVVHTHSTFATTLACLGKSLPPIHYLVAFAGAEVPCIPYHPFGSDELAQAAAQALEDPAQKAILLGNHGALACGSTIEEAFSVADELEFCAELYWRSLCAGEPKPLSETHIRQAQELLQGYGS